MNGSSMTGKCSFVPFSVHPFLRALDGALATFVVPPGVALPTATSRAPRACFALPSASTSFTARDTPYVHMTLLTSSLQKQAPRRWGQPSALAKHINARESVRACAEMRSDGWHALITPPPRWSSPGNALMFPSLCITCASTGTCWTRSLLVAFDGQLRASVSASLRRGLAGPLLVDKPDHGRLLRRTGPPHTAVGIALPCIRR